MDVVEQIRQAVDIVAIINEVVPIKKRGRDYTGLCPFHGEKTPSFSVSPTKQLFYCFGCHAGGNVFNFVQRYYNWDFQQALEELGRRAGIKVESIKSDPLWEEGLELLELAANAFEDNLRSKSGDHFRDYLKTQRRIPEKIWSDFRLGSHPGDNQFLVKLIHSKKLSKELAASLGLIGKMGSDYSDRCRGRLMFPIIDEKGRVRGFGARTLGNEQPKYINSPKSSVFDKSRLFYGMHLAPTPIGKKGYAVLVEGYLDVIALHEFGVTNTLGAMGTALTAEQIRLLKRLTGRVISLYDADRAGLAATEKNLGNFLREGLEAKVVILPTGKDPDAFLHQPQVSAADLRSQLKTSFENSTSAVDFLVKNSVLTEETPMQRAKKLRDLIRILDEIPDEVERDYIKRDLAKRFELNESIMLGTKPEAQGASFDRVRETVPQGASHRAPQNIDLWERETLRFAIQYGEKLAFTLTDIIPFLSSSRWSQVLLRLNELGSDSRQIAALQWMSDTDARLQDPETKAAINHWIFEQAPEIEEQDLQTLWADLKKGLKKSYYQRYSRELQDRIIAAEKSGSGEELMKLISEKRDLVELMKVTD